MSSVSPYIYIISDFYHTQWEIYGWDLKHLGYCHSTFIFTWFNWSSYVGYSFIYI